jgi:hypothetical protein
MQAARDIGLDDSPLAQVLETCARRGRGEDGVLEPSAATMVLSFLCPIPIIAPVIFLLVLLQRIGLKLGP